MNRRDFVVNTGIAWLLLGAGRLPEPFAGLDDYVQRFVVRSDFAGVVAIRRGSLRRVLYVGDRALRPSPTDTFAIGSISKHMTSAALLILQRAGKLSISDRLTKFYPELATGEATLAQMMSHLGGIARDFPIVTDRLTPSEAVKLAAGMKLLTGPIGQFAYSNVAYALLAAVVEQAAHVPYAQFMHAHLFVPAAMRSTGCFTNHRPPTLATPYIPQLGETLSPVPDSWREAIPGAGTVYSTAEDMMRWDRALWDGSILPADFMRTIAAERPPQYRDGLAIASRMGHKVVGHDGQMTGFVARYDHFPGADATLLALGNVDTQAIDVMKGGLTNVLFGERPADPHLPELSTQAIPKGVAANFAGSYSVTPTFSFDVIARPTGLYIPGNGRHLSAMTPMVGGGFFYRELYARVHFAGAGTVPAPELVWVDSGGTYHCKRKASNP